MFVKTSGFAGSAKGKLSYFRGGFNLMCGNTGKTHLAALYVQEKVANDMYKSAITEEEKEYYQKELNRIRTEIENISVCS